MDVLERISTRIVNEVSGITEWFMTLVRSRLVRLSGSNAGKSFHHRGHREHRENQEESWESVLSDCGSELCISNLKFETNS